MSFIRGSFLLLVLLCACANPAPREDGPEGDGSAQPELRELFVYRACDSSAPGEMVPLSREVPAHVDPAAAAIAELLRGVTPEERALGCTSFFSSRTEDALRSVRRHAGGDTLSVDFDDFSAAIPDVPGARSFLPPGIMAELTWTIFHQFAEIQAVRLSFEGDEGAFWTWIGGAGTEPQAFTREMWERV